MMRRLVHPWWIHVPAGLVLLAYTIHSLWVSGSWPSRVPLQVGLDGQPQTWGAPWIAFAVVVGLGLFFLGLSVVIDELWARQETGKHFNPLTLLDDVVIGLLVTIQGGLAFAPPGIASTGLPWGVTAAGSGIALVAASLLEVRRPIAERPETAVEPCPETFARLLAARLQRGERIVYWDVQNPVYMTGLSLGLPVLFWGVAGVSYRYEVAVSILLGVLGLLFIQFYGGQRTRVTNDTVTIRYGLAGLRVFRCETVLIRRVSIRSFSALREFGGYGIRWTRSTVGYFLGGSRGVGIEIEGRRSVLIGSNHPERLAETIRAVGRLAEVRRGEREEAQ